MLTPWLVYADYPRKTTRSIPYIAKKGFSFAFLLILLYLLHSEYILPVIQRGSGVSYVEMVLTLMLPVTMFEILGFYMVFDCLCNFFAEITFLDSREFYQDWWNSTTFEEFNRRWNRPVYNFLYRHVYLEVMVRHQMKKFYAQLITFVFSALLHEFLLSMVFRMVYPLMFFSMVGQIPLIYLTRWMQNNKSGLYLFWMGLILGEPLLVAGYLKANDQVVEMFTKAP